MAISFVGWSAAATNTVALPTFTTGDLAIVLAFRDGSNTAPTTPAGWTSITASGTFTCAINAGYRVLVGGDTTTGVWTNATEIEVIVLRGQRSGSPIGNFAVSGATSDAIMEYVGFDLAGDTTSWLVGMAGNKTATDTKSAAITDASPGVPADWTNRSSGGAVGTISCHTRAGVGQAYADFTVNAASDWRSIEIEVLAPVTTQTGVARISLASASVPATRTSHSITVRARKTNALHTATLGVHLYEGATQRTNTELTQLLTSSLADYTLGIADADAVAITSYANLELRIRGFSTTGDLATFEVARIVLNLPAASGFTVPSAPQTPQAVGSDQQVLLTWIAPASDGGSAVLSYNIYRSLTPGGEVLYASPAGTGTSYVDNAVTNGTAYYYKVSAVNAVGESALTSEVSATPSTPPTILTGRTLKRLYGPALLSNAAATLYTCPAQKVAVIRHIHISNPSGSPVNFTFSIGSDTAGRRLWDAEPQPANDYDDHLVEHDLTEGEVIQAFASSANVLNLTVDGYELGVSQAPPPPAIYPADNLYPHN